ncbi:hypothetical protein CPAST_c03390 [Clostridium pasteurianum DSM 525 = ATCC 6013]|uniref:Uncharacterized protein n=1 Tax=Clostridium pasteurianum DSM 525 = ATCC 6013 TaxID=1262449 RepID=A0A0H3IZI1_CLOPA|nr:DUF523 domain-containing protein [Clostridium pasteurianum]AJA46439.1 hypothetical protein CPAST_c03390 [Clostridium pasteurianum DSM 525 = ATCC 6013]AJA50427.1 hypothetical protein CLPA_c03390 [Clostridium pasteurianum DSM 525 = ATCC 6013]AOZ73873.1 purine nucleoside phosphorylase [Clostridium pasteurianum DSM 525 = ATCC 6013]AOZ77670.1 purine nucleoside phosphorylase [Clostridium pasteurianum]ELP61014.1 hypothetical protein F502_01115 [Clostridium pasteurianum DSM 525 = ATCC 6013]
MYLISACLGGVNCRYDGKNSENKFVMDLMKQGKAMLVCPEQLGGLKTPRVSCEITLGDDGIKKVLSKDGEDFTDNFTRGAEEVLKIAKAMGIEKAILKSKSPSCGCGIIYDGTFSGKLIEGEGLTAELLMKNGIEVCTEKDI